MLGVALFLVLTVLACVYSGCGKCFLRFSGTGVDEIVLTCLFFLSGFW